MSDWKNPDQMDEGGITPQQEQELTQSLLRSLGLLNKKGLNIAPPLVKAFIKKDDEWPDLFKTLPYYGKLERQDINAIQERLLDKYPMTGFIKKTINTLGLDESKLTPNFAYQKVMAIDPAATSNREQFRFWKEEGSDLDNPPNDLLFDTRIIR